MANSVAVDDPLIAKHPQTKPFWAAAAEGRFVLPRCLACGQAHWYPRPQCPHCSSPDLEWISATGRGVVYSFSVMRRALTPYVLAFVTLEEGPTMMTNIVGCDVDDVRIGQAVMMQMTQLPSGRHMPFFSPAASVSAKKT